MPNEKGTDTFDFRGPIPAQKGVRSQFVYPAGANNGRIAESIDGVTGEDVQYTYDSLQRLVSAETNSSGPQWGTTYFYDGFGNLTDKRQDKGSTPPFPPGVVYDPATNWPYSGNFDANGNAPIGNWTVENRLLSQTLDGSVFQSKDDPGR